MHSRILLAIALLFSAHSVAETLSEQRRSELRNLLHQDCGSCHGMRLTGGLGPALTSQALAGKSQAFLNLAITEGRAGTPMPPWKDMLTGTEINWIVKYLKQGGATQ